MATKTNSSRPDSPVGGRPLVIVESPAKAKTIAGFLGADFVVESSIGHIRDIPESKAGIPEGAVWGRHGVDVDNGFTPLYVVADAKKAQVSKLKTLLKDASELYLATDEDREGESIAWHLLEVLKPKVPVKRMVFHEITRAAIQRAVEEWRELDRNLVDAQEARRILDRLYGYDVSEVVWRKVMPKLSAGRVQSPATRLIVDRERARMRFRSAGYWDIVATVAKDDQRDASFDATLISLDGRRLVTGKDFEETGELTSAARAANAVVLQEPDARGLAARLETSAFAVRSVEERPYRRSPYAPFMTSTLQQEAGRKLRYSSQRTMSLAQRLYENGYITYMRTDSTTLSDTALSAARAQARELYGDEYVPDTPRRYEKKVKNAQEAHEAIRPAGDTFRTPREVEAELPGDEARLYELIWMRTLASQMADARGLSMQVRLGATSSTGENAEFSASGKVITFPGFLRAYVEGADDPDAELEDREVRLPPVAAGDALAVEALAPTGHSTQPPPRYTEASLIKALEEMGVGRPSTYASIMEVIQNRGYAWKKGSALIPSFTAFAVVRLLEQHFSDLVDYEFTARMENDLDRMASGEQQSVPWLTKFYFGDDRTGRDGPADGVPSDGAGPQPGPDGEPGGIGLWRMVSERLSQIDAAEINTIVIGDDEQGREIVVKPGRFGPYVKRGDETASVPDDLPPDELTVERAVELLMAPKSDRIVGEDPASGLTVFAKAGRFGPYIQLGEPSTEKKAPKPPTASLFKTMTVESVTLDQALQLLTLPRVVGADPTDGQEIVAANGRFGPFIKRGTDSRSIDAEEQLLTITLDEALAVFAQPKMRRGQRAAAAAPLKEIGVDPVSQKPVTVRDGRFGPYVTDGETNASLRRGDDPEAITMERAAELLAERRAKLASGEVTPRKTIKRGAAGAAKKAAPKKTTAKKTATATKAKPKKG